MTSQGSIVKRVFPGGNTPQGFHSFFEHILPNPRRLIIIKGGPGVGKSTLMGWVSQRAREQGYNVEHHYCSSDPDSLDALVIPELRVGLLDGTAPHIVDPEYPGAVQEIFNMGVFWDQKGIEEQRDEIIGLTGRISLSFKSAYRYLRAAHAVYEEWQAVQKEALDPGRVNRVAADLIEDLLDVRRVSLIPGRVRRLFASSVGPKGPVHHLDSLFEPLKTRVVLTGEPGTGKELILARICQEAAERGLDVEAYHCPFNPQNLDHLIIPELSVGLTTSVWPHVWTLAATDREVALSACLHPSKVGLANARGEEARKRVEPLYSQAVAAFRQCKALHDELEGFYIPHMDFESVNRVRTELVARLLPQ